jgi:hypothetical protein
MELNCFIKQVYIALKEFEIDEVHFDIGCVGDFNSVDKYALKIDDSSKQRIKFIVNMANNNPSKSSRDEQFYKKRRSLVERINKDIDGMDKVQ